MNLSRRELLKMGLLAVCGTVIPLSALEVFKPEAAASLIRPYSEKKRWAFVVDTTKCVGCGMCVKACKLENEIPFDTDVQRTWVERYIQLKNGEVIIDSPHGARYGFTKNDPQGKDIDEAEIAKGLFVPKLCNHCEKPSCVQVCPVGATYKTDDGVVLVDRKWCIGCGYCITNCPYFARFFHPITNTADKCTFCYHRITKGMNTACSDACAFGVRKIGMLNDPASEVFKIINTSRVMVLKPEYGNEPHVFYIGLDDIVR
ncbi:4Fe-4S dicluster domain-containing protein [Candidatus Magnetominusculus dajiuhuensis]|uniref:4Fe-4S dicluster domain-containing protein n=1 Tax=Candidatus Magnetominusculus dajiuhuensis TaxID=3137712 RepID=UPI003B436CA2